MRMEELSVQVEHSQSHTVNVPLPGTRADSQARDPVHGEQAGS